MGSRGGGMAGWEKLCVAVGGVAAVVCGFVGEAWHGALGAMVGFVLGLGGFGLLYLLLCLLYDLAWGGFPALPTCRRGVCTCYDYQGGVKLADGRAGVRCDCGEGYRKRGRRFVRVDDDGAEHPFRIWVPFGGWREDSDDPAV